MLIFFLNLLRNATFYINKSKLCMSTYCEVMEIKMMYDCYYRIQEICVVIIYQETTYRSVKENIFVIC